MADQVFAQKFSFIFYVYGLRNEAVSSSGYTASNNGMPEA
jgi:hypothetical protein